MREKTSVRKIENKISRKSILKKKEAIAIELKRSKRINSLLLSLRNPWNVKFVQILRRSMTKLKFCMYLPLLYSANLNTPAPGNVYILSKLKITEIWLAVLYFRSFGPSRMKDSTVKIVLKILNLTLRLLNARALFLIILCSWRNRSKEERFL